MIDIARTICGRDPPLRRDRGGIRGRHPRPGPRENTRRGGRRDHRGAPRAREAGGRRLPDPHRAIGRVPVRGGRRRRHRRGLPHLPACRARGRGGARGQARLLREAARALAGAGPRHGPRLRGGRRHAGRRPRGALVPRVRPGQAAARRRRARAARDRHAHARILLGRDRALDYALATLRWPDGPIAHLEASWAEHDGFRTAFEVRGDKGMLVHDSRASAPLATQMAGGPAGPAMIPMTTLHETPYARQMRELVAGLSGGESRFVTGREGLRSLALALTVIEAADSGEVVRWRPPE